LITNSKGKYLPYQIRTTREAINSPSDIERKAYQYLEKIGDVEIINDSDDLNE